MVDEAAAAERARKHQLASQSYRISVLRGQV
jgi:hypothetical protein